MLSRFKLLAFFGALLLAVAIETTIKNAEPSTIKDLLKLTYSNSSTLSHQAGNKEEKTVGVDFSEDEIRLGPSEPCECSAKDIKQALAPFNGLDPPFEPAYRDGKAQTIKLPDQISEGVTCRRADGTSACGRLQYTFTDLESRVELITFPHKGIFWDASLNQITLQPKISDPTGPHKILVTAQLLSFKDVLETAEIAYVVHPAPGDLLQNEEQSEPTDTGQPSRILSPGQAYCTNPATMLNLFNTAALAEQSSFVSAHSQTASTGCDGEVMMINTATYAWDYTKLVHSAVGGTPSVPQWWKITLQQPTSIKTTLLINRDDAFTDKFPHYTATVGNNTDVTQNPVCVPLGAMTDGGWYPCPNSMIGTTFGVYTTSLVLNFMEAMAYSQEAIHMNAGITMSSLGTNNSDFTVNNAIQKQVVLNADDSARQKCVIIDTPAGGLATQSIKFPAQIFIKGVMLLPGYRQGVASLWKYNQNNVKIYGKTVGGTQQLCEVTQNYYSTTYYEVACNIQANEIILVQQNAAFKLRFCGFGALADCDCGQSSFDRLLFTTPLTTPFASVTSISVKSTDSTQQIQFNLQAPDTVSSVCGNSDGISKCGTRQLSFKDKMTGLEIQQWPYKGYNFDVTTSKLTIDPAQAYATSVLTATISLQNYPTTFMSQDITVVVQGLTAAQVSTLALVNQPPTFTTPIGGPFQFEYGKQWSPSYQLPSTIDPEGKAVTIAVNCGSASSFLAYNTATNTFALSNTAATNIGIYTITIVLTDSDGKYSSYSFQLKITDVPTSASTTATTPTTTTTLKTTQTQKSSSAEPTTSVVVDYDFGTEVTAVSYAATDQKVLLNLAAENYAEAANSTTFDWMSAFQKAQKRGSDHKNKIIVEPDVQISSISNYGLVTFAFTKAMVVSPLEMIQNAKVEVNNNRKSRDLTVKQMVKALQIRAKPGQESLASNLRLSYNITKFTSSNMEVQLNFTKAIQVSSNIGFPDYLEATFLGNFFFFDTDGMVLPKNKVVSYKLPSQMQFGTQATKVLVAVAEAANTASTGIMASNLALNIILSASLQHLWSMVNTQQLVVLMPLWNIRLPANAAMFFGFIMTIASFDLLPTDTFYNEYFPNMAPTTAINANFQAIGFSSMYFNYNIGSLILSFLAFPVLALVALILKPLRRFKCCNWLYLKITSTIYWNSTIQTISQSYTVIVMCVGINTLNVSAQALIQFSLPLPAPVRSQVHVSHYSSEWQQWRSQSLSRLTFTRISKTSIRQR